MTEPGRLGAGQPCPHCGAKSGVGPDGDGGHICLVCGGPRIVVDAGIALSGAELPHLERAKALRGGRAAWAAGSAVVGGFGVLAALIALLAAAFVELGVFSGLLLIVMVLAPLVLSVYGWRKVRMLSGERRAALDAARQVVVKEILDQRRGKLEASELAPLLHLSEDDAVELLSRAEADRYLEVSTAPTERFRIDAGDPGAAGPDTAESLERRHRSE